LTKHKQVTFLLPAALLALLVISMPCALAHDTAPSEREPDSRMQEAPPLHMVALLPSDDFASRRHQCASEMFTESGELLARLDGTALMARLNTPVFIGENKPRSPLIELVALEKSRSFGHYTFTFNGASGLHADKRLRQQLYVINVSLAKKTPCHAKAGWLCSSYSGTVSFASQLMGELDHPNPTPPMNITFRDECEKEGAQDGLFVFTGLMDRLGAIIFMGGSR
jgi:hypothetical protein